MRQRLRIMAAFADYPPHRSAECIAASQTVYSESADLLSVEIGIGSKKAHWTDEVCACTGETGEGVERVTCLTVPIRFGSVARAACIDWCKVATLFAWKSRAS